MSMQKPYRGIHNGGWKKGFLSYNFKTNEYEIVNFQGAWPVIEDSVGQSTGLNDRENVEIYGSDIIQFWWIQENEWGPPVAVEMKSYCPSGDDRITGWWADDSPVTENCRVIGNIHQNPELLEKT